MTTPSISIQLGTGPIAAPGKPVLNAALGEDITLIDSTVGGTPQDRVWRIASMPAALTAAPELASYNAGTTDFVVPLDGMYIVHMQRRDLGIWRSAFTAIGVPNDAGVVIPAAGFNGALARQLGTTDEEKAAAERGGWAGSAIGNSDVLMEAALRVVFAFMASTVTGLKGDTGDPGPPGVTNTMTQTVGDQVIPALGDTAVVSVLSTGWISPSAYLRVQEGDGTLYWEGVATSKSFSTVSVTAKHVVNEGGVVPEGAYVILSGERGPQGVVGPLGHTELTTDAGELSATAWSDLPNGLGGYVSVTVPLLEEGQKLRIAHHREVVLVSGAGILSTRMKVTNGVVTYYSTEDQPVAYYEVPSSGNYTVTVQFKVAGTALFRCNPSAGNRTYCMLEAFGV